MSHFPLNKTLRDFDFGFHAGINKEKILDFASLWFLDKRENVVFMGSPGVGRTHLAMAIGIEAASQRISTYFINFAVLTDEFKTSQKRTGQSSSSSIT